MGNGQDFGKMCGLRKVSNDSMSKPVQDFPGPGQVTCKFSTKRVELSLRRNLGNKEVEEWEQMMTMLEGDSLTERTDTAVWILE